MKKTLTHLPQKKQVELEIIRDIILEKVPDVRMVVLFGSYARGDWVEDIHSETHTTHVYESDFDILVATKSKKVINVPCLVGGYGRPFCRQGPTA